MACNVTDFAKLAKDSGYLCFDIEFDDTQTHVFAEDFHIHGCGFSSVDNGEIVAEYVTDKDRIRSIIEATFPDPDIQIIAHNAKFDLNCLKRVGLYPCDPQIRCTMVGLNLLDDNLDSRHLGLKPSVLRMYGHKMEDFKTASAGGLDSNEFRKYAVEDAYYELRIFLDIEEQLQPFWDLYTRILMPSLITFSDMELFGIYWDQDSADEFYSKLYSARQELKKKIISRIGRLNIDSNAQLANRLFYELGYNTKFTEKGKSGNYSVDSSVLEPMSGKYPVCGWIMAYRTCGKLIGTYLEPIQKQCHDNFDSRIHSSYWLTSKTGRTRCSQVNNQNMPARINSKLGDLGKIFEDVKIRKACASPEGKKLVVVDFSQLELRLAGHVMAEKDFLDAYCNWTCHSCNSKGRDTVIQHVCPNCGQAENEKDFSKGIGFWQGEDLHTSVLNYVPQRLRSKLSRNDGKVLNFAIIYNASAWRLHYEHPQLSPDDWQTAIDNIMSRRKSAQKYHKMSDTLLRNKGYRDTIFGRRRRIPPSLYQTNGRFDPKRYKHCLNEFINSPIQGPGSTLCQVAMFKLRDHWIEKGWWGNKAKLVNMIHDELVVECDEDVAEQVLADTIYWMENAAEFTVPIRAEGAIVDSWDQAK